MLFNSPAFALFLPLMLAVYWSLRGTPRRWSLLIGSYFFYGWWDWRFLSLLILSTCVDYFVSQRIEAQSDVRRRRGLLLISVVTNLGLLATFKYFNFFADSARAALAVFGVDSPLPALDVLLPMGISFYTFQTLSYTIDVYRGGKAERSLLNFAIFVACFPQLVAGPIMRASELLPQIGQRKTFAGVDWSTGVFRIFRGLFKKMVIADALAVYVDTAFAAPGEFTGISAWIALYAYAFQIYMDFSGYTDVAIGVGHLLGLRLTENFDRPYVAASPSEFWRRWHITLSTWLRDYLYIPLGGSRRGSWITKRNLFITMALGGLWHGAAWTFVAWGIYHGVLLAGERMLGMRKRATDGQPRQWGTRLLSIVVMFHLTCLGWLLFRAPDWSTVMAFLESLFDFSGDVRGLRCAAIVALCMFAHAWPFWKTLGERFARLPAAGQGVLAAMSLWALLLLSPHAQPFIYFQF